MILKKIQNSDDIKKLSETECHILADELRAFLLENVSKTGGHLASNLGVVELTIAIHRVFDTAKDRLVFDVGHQCYVHKILTGRRDRFDTLRQYQGISGFPKPYESVHDAFVAGHASNSVSVALGMARARTLKGEDYNVLALIGDGALTGGLAYEGLNAAGESGEPLIIILNDNGMSISGNVGGVSEHLKELRTQPAYYSFKKWYRGLFGDHAESNPLYQISHGIKTTLKNSLYPSSTLFEDMGFTYLGPVDGHDIEQITNALQWAKELRKPVVIHINTEKGKGYSFAEQEPNLYHGVGAFDPRFGVSRVAKRDFSAVAGESLAALAEEDDRICAITAAMKEGTGLAAFAERFPKRFFDVGIAEGHAVSFAGGLAKQGMIPVFAVYSTFLQRGFDELLEDIALDRLHAVFCVDRAGLVGSDGETHHGIFDVGYLASVPGMTVFAPSNYAELKSMLKAAVEDCAGPAALRYPRGCMGEFAEDTSSSAFVKLGNGADGVIVCYGTMVNHALEAARKLATRGMDICVCKLNVISPLPKELLTYLSTCSRILAAEECNETGCVGQRLAAGLSGNKNRLRLCNLGDTFPPQGSLQELYRAYGLDADGLAARMEEMR